MESFTPTENFEHPVQQLHELILSEFAADSPNGASGRRPALSVAVRLDDGSSLQGNHAHFIEEVTGSKLVIKSDYHFKEGQILQIEMLVHNHLWQDRMRVVHVVPVWQGFRVDLESELEVSAGSPSADRPVCDPSRQLRRLARERAWLDVARDEIRKAAGAYLLAHRSLGLLGVSARKDVARALAKIPGSATGRAPDERRRHERRQTQADTYIVLRGEPEWRILEARIVDVSLGGVRVAVPGRSAEQSYGSGPEPQDELESGKAVVVGLGSGPDALWVPAEVIWLEMAEGQDWHIRLKIATPLSLEAFS